MYISLPRYAPMLAKASANLPLQSDDYALEVKWDGIRALIYIANNTVQIISRNGFDITFRYPELQALSKAVGKHSVILDGEIIAFDESNSPSFSLLQRRMNLEKPALIQTLTESIPVTYVIFDLLQAGKTVLIDKPYTFRRKKLEQLSLSGQAWSTPEYQTGNAASFLEASCKLGLEGIVLKRLSSMYLPGKRSDNWLKVKNFKRQEFIIAGWTPGEGKRSGSIGALLLGYYLPDTSTAASQGERILMYAGSCGTGFDAKTLTDLNERLVPLVISECPFAANPQKNGAIYVKPELVGEFSFAEWTPAQTLRHPSFLGLRTDKAAGQVIRELP